MDSSYKLKWNEHLNFLFGTLQSVYKTAKYSDVTLTCEGSFYSAHKLILSNCSNYFSNILDQIEEKHNPIIVLPETPKEHIEALLQYMYEGEAVIKQSELQSFMKTAENLQIIGLIDKVPGKRAHSDEENPPSSKKQNLNNQSPKSCSAFVQKTYTKDEENVVEKYGPDPDYLECAIYESPDGEVAANLQRCLDNTVDKEHNITQQEANFPHLQGPPVCEACNKPVKGSLDNHKCRARVGDKIWTDEATNNLLRFFLENKTLFNNSNRRQELFQKAKENLAEQNFIISAEDIRNKFKTLKTTYTRRKEKQITTGSMRQAWIFFDKMDELHRDNIINPLSYHPSDSLPADRASTVESNIAHSPILTKGINSQMQSPLSSFSTEAVESQVSYGKPSSSISGQSTCYVMDFTETIECVKSETDEVLHSPESYEKLSSPVSGQVKSTSDTFDSTMSSIKLEPDEVEL